MLYHCEHCGWSHDLRITPRTCPKCGVGRNGNVHPGVERTRRLVGWLRFFRLPADSGVGDTATRLLTSTQPATDARRELERLLAKCSCSRVDAVERLNREHGW